MTEKRTKKKRGVKIAEYDINGQKLQDLTMTDTTFDGVNDIHVYIQKKDKREYIHVIKYISIKHTGIRLKT